MIAPDTAVLGIDLGTSGVRIAILDLAGNLRHSEGMPYPGAFEDPAAWVDGCRQLIASIPSDLRQRLRALAVDGTSGTLLACEEDGRPLGPALPYHLSCPEQLERLNALISDSNPAGSASGSLARALRLLETHPRDQLLLRHQADWITGWFLQSWRYGEEGNNLRLGWNLETGRWPDTFARQLWCQALPEIRPSGALLGSIAPSIADQLGCPPNLQVIAGTTDSNAAVLTANPSAGDGITVLGSTIVLKRFVKTPLAGAGVTNHRVGGRWLCGGASNSGGVVLQQQFPGIDLEELSRQIDPEQNSGLDLRPLPARGERFPIDDPTLEPILRPRPVSDALYLHGLLEGMARIEAQGWRRLTELGAQPPKQVITVGGGARNPQWRRLRERILGLAVRSCHAPPAAGTARLALEGLQQAADLHG